MIGKILLFLLLALLLLLATALWVPIRVRVSYNQGEVSVVARFGLLCTHLYPRPEKGDRTGSNQEKRTRASPKKGNRKKKTPLKLNRAQILSAVESLPPILLRALRRVGRGVHISPLKVYLLVAGPDPADTAQLFGKLQAGLSAGLPILHRLTHIRDPDIQIFIDFQREQMDCIADIGVAMRGWTLLWTALCAGGSTLKWFLGLKKLVDPSSKEESEKAEKKEEAGTSVPDRAISSEEMGKN